ncbi:hypothetical protein RHSIM_Rhsim12G0073000 [Rhododendron simsii]|uniref:Uncharacterized protein n=1 Tax=Rhododendron simsii TaxID=118357 RepID=A0A834L8T1_RHOSS|nr:hypothetical protein RHSIM_Rhsim12G0073000 [Rhododendron simsii]
MQSAAFLLSPSIPPRLSHRTTTLTHNPISTPPHSRSVDFAASINGLSGFSLRQFPLTQSHIYTHSTHHIYPHSTHRHTQTHNGHTHIRNPSQTKPPPLSLFLSHGNEDSKLPSTTSANGGAASSVRATGGEAGAASLLASKIARKLEKTSPENRDDIATAKDWKEILKESGWGGKEGEREGEEDRDDAANIFRIDSDFALYVAESVRFYVFPPVRKNTGDHKAVPRRLRWAVAVSRSKEPSNFTVKTTVSQSTDGRLNPLPSVQLYSHPRLANMEGLTRGSIMANPNVLINLQFSVMEVLRWFRRAVGRHLVVRRYQIAVLELLAQSTYEGNTINWSKHLNESMGCQLLEVHPPRVLDLFEDTEYASQAALWGIEGLPDLGEIYPLGGSADRLGLVDPQTAAAREFLYFKLYGKQCVIPVAIMTSSAKNNHERITSLCERLGGFGRGRSLFQFFEHSLLPAVGAEDGQWLVTRQFMPVCKPGGHGVIWKLACDKGIFQWFYNHGRKGATVRQVSNVLAATDLTLLALAGIGFASCKRILGATEGKCLVEKKNLDGMWAYGLSCIEYTEFDKFGISEGPLSSHRHSLTLSVLSSQKDDL